MTMKHAFQQITELCKLYEQPIGDVRAPTYADLTMRLRIIFEELGELIEAIVGPGNGFVEVFQQMTEAFLRTAAVAGRDGDPIDPESFVHVTDAIVDLTVVALGAGVSWGVPFAEAWEVIHASNMAKAAGPKRPDGKKMKPEGWRPPDIAGVIAKAAATAPLQPCGCLANAHPHRWSDVNVSAAARDAAIRNGTLCALGWPTRRDEVNPPRAGDMFKSADGTLRCCLCYYIIVQDTCALSCPGNHVPRHLREEPLP